MRIPYDFRGFWGDSGQCGWAKDKHCGVFASFCAAFLASLPDARRTGMKGMKAVSSLPAPPEEGSAGLTLPY